MLDKTVESVLRRNFNNYVSHEINAESNKLIVTVPKADSMFFREMVETPILQNISAFNKFGMRMETSFFVEETEDVCKITIPFEKLDESFTRFFKEKSEIASYMYYEDKDDSDDPDWEVTFKDGTVVKSKGNNSEEAVANATKNHDGEVEKVEFIDENYLFLKRILEI